MKRLEKPIQKSGLVVTGLDPEHYKTFQDNLFTALKKFGSSRKTRAVHKLIDKNMVDTAMMVGDAIESLVAPALKNNTLYDIILNMHFYDDSLAGRGAVNLATDLLTVRKKIHQEETFVNEARLHNLEKLQAKEAEIQEKLLKSFDYIKMVDGIYLGWLLVMSHSSLKADAAGKAKIVTVAADILAATLKKLYLQINTGMEPEVHQLIEAISIYFIKIYYYGESASYVLNQMKKAFSEEIIDAIQRAKVTKIDDFSDISKLLKETELMPITPTTFDMQMNRMFGKHAYQNYIQPALVTYLAYMANMAQPNLLFRDSYPIDEELHTRLEELLLNEQKKIVLREKDVS